MPRVLVPEDIPYRRFVKDMAAEIVRQIKMLHNHPEMISQNKAYKLFGRGNVDRWRRKMKITPHARPGKIEYRMEELIRAQNEEQDYF